MGETFEECLPIPASMLSVVLFDWLFSPWVPLATEHQNVFLNYPFSWLFGFSGSSEYPQSYYSWYTWLWCVN